MSTIDRLVSLVIDAVNPATLVTVAIAECAGPR